MKPFMATLFTMQSIFVVGTYMKSPFFKMLTNGDHRYLIQIGTRQKTILSQSYDSKAHISDLNSQNNNNILHKA